MHLCKIGFLLKDLSFIPISPLSPLNLSSSMILPMCLYLSFPMYLFFFHFLFLYLYRSFAIPFFVYLSPYLQRTSFSLFCLNLSISRSLYLSLYLSSSLFSMPLSPYPHIFLNLSLFISLFLSHFIYLPLYLSVSVLK